jgi:glucose-6-phosphate isomerase
MLDLEQVSGIPMEVTDDFHLKLKPGAVQTGTSIVRKFSEMVPVLLDPNTKPSRDEMYYVNRGISVETDKDSIAADRLQYDVTVIPPGFLGDEYTKTLGHYHDNIPGSTMSHPELYEVLNGKALFLLQKVDSGTTNAVNTILAIEAGKGDKIIYPPNYAHIIVNIGDEVLVTANWVSTEYKPLYEPIKECQGMALYVVKGKDGNPTFIKNNKYPDQPIMRKMAIGDKIRTDFGLNTKEPMYTSAMKNPKLLDFLNHPAKYAVELSALSS